VQAVRVRCAGSGVSRETAPKSLHWFSRFATLFSIIRTRGTTDRQARNSGSFQSSFSYWVSIAHTSNTFVATVADLILRLSASLYLKG
jgi:hypothetical protein